MFIECLPNLEKRKHPLTLIMLSYVCCGDMCFLFQNVRMAGSILCHTMRHTYKHTPSTCFVRYPAGRYAFLISKLSLFLLRPTLKNIRVCCIHIAYQNMIFLCVTLHYVAYRPTFLSCSPSKWEH